MLEIALWKKQLKGGWSKDDAKRQAGDREECRKIRSSMSTVANKKEDEEEEIRSLIKLSKTPDLSGNDNWTQMTKLDLFQAGLSTLPSSLATLLPNLSILFCMKNKFQEIPEVIGQCPNLQMISFKSNQVESIHPNALQEQLRWLILTDNKIQELPSTIGRCKKLQKCMLSGNCLERLPPEISNCHNLELIRLASNKLTEPPMELLKLPNLAWVALSDNPFLDKVAGGATTGDELLHLDVWDEDTTLDDPTVGVELGKGASGVTRRYTTKMPSNHNNHNKNNSISTKKKRAHPDNTSDDSSSTPSSPSMMITVAVKEYFSTITSDGNPQEERKVSMVASSLECKSLVHVHGRTPKGNLIMELLKDYKVFANPPSLESCSRDTYPDDEQCSETRALAMVDELLTALMKLHQHGICHGDFYGHNILICTKDETAVWLTDFGAAFFYEPSSEYGKLIQQVERRAFSHLLDEIAALLPPTTASSCQDKIKTLSSHCASMTFEELHQKWTELK
ncbi:unnamed protein product [Cylindrotheca closterium]|uniref:Protein kinase domain-containing protein n=1 Tax=Cylindrotheca closterium TaxID=2856 RepID=A0AAD2FPJ1_9STRA|nr:unnamed protein product [Cylindrotheca closterium]